MRWLSETLGLHDLFARWAWIALLALGIAFFWGAHFYVQLATLRPFLVFITVDGHAPPVCGLCVLFGS